MTLGQFFGAASDFLAPSHDARRPGRFRAPRLFAELLLLLGRFHRNGRRRGLGLRKPKVTTAAVCFGGTGLEVGAKTAPQIS